MRRILLTIAFCLGTGGLFGQGLLTKPQHVWRHNLTLTPEMYLIRHLNAAYDLRLVKKQAIGLDVMYAPKWLWYSPRYSESIWSRYGPFYGKAVRLRLRYKIYPFQNPNGNAPRFFAGIAAVYRNVAHQNIAWRNPDSEELGLPPEVINVDVRRQALMMDIVLGHDFSIGNLSWGWFVGASLGRQWTNAVNLGGGSIPNWKKVQYPRQVGGPRAGFTIGYNWGSVL